MVSCLQAFQPKFLSCAFSSPPSIIVIYLWTRSTSKRCMTKHRTSKMYSEYVAFSVELPELTVNVQTPCVLLRAATDVSVLSTTREGLPRIIRLWQESECAGSHISVWTCLKHYRKYPSTQTCNLRTPFKMVQENALWYDLIHMRITHRTSWSSGWHPCVALGMSHVRISSWRPAIQTQVFRTFTQFLQANAGIVP
jgi:hypothetical protein